SWTSGTPKEKNFLGYEGLETQAIAGIGVHRMRCDTNVMSEFSDYKDLFDYAFPTVAVPERYDVEHAGLAIAAYERTLLANESPWQLWLNGSSTALSDHQKEGAYYFFSKAECYKCHTGPALNSMEFHALGMGDLDGPGIYGTSVDDLEKKGRGGFTNKQEDMYKFKVPQLYNLKDSKFYGHGGSFTSVHDVIMYKNKGQAENEDVPEDKLADEFHPLNLTSEEISAITDFIENGLRDPNLSRYQPYALPSGNCFPNNDALSKIDLGCIP
ncbi:MAG: cytochrome-c peroxidase, partial [Bacteroidia bacterium]|nr:cytochrome-c peroxidase [Bacteroidia bacterium]